MPFFRFLCYAATLPCAPCSHHGLPQASCQGSDDALARMHQWGTVYQAVGQLVREFESGIHDKLVENASADVREAIRFVPTPTNGASVLFLQS